MKPFEHKILPVKKPKAKKYTAIYEVNFGHGIGNVPKVLRFDKYPNETMEEAINHDRHDTIVYYKNDLFRHVTYIFEGHPKLVGE